MQATVANHAAAAQPTATPPVGRQARSALLLALSDIKIAHSVFAMPFALLAAFIAGHQWTRVEKRFPLDWVVSGRAIRWSEFAGELALIVACMFFARTWAMLVNRLADARFDAHNPRTARRAIAAGRLSRRAASGATAVAGAGFIAACAAFLLFGNALPLLLSIPVLAWIALYSFTKRATWACHLFLGGALAVSPIAAAIAIDPQSLIGLAAYYDRDGSLLATDDNTRLALLFLSAFILFWVAGFDIAYAMQDIDFDRMTGLHSIPARLGPRGALLVSRAFHAAAFLFLVLASRADPRFGSIFVAAVALVGALLVFEHIVLARRGVVGLPIAFFTVNGVVSCVLGGAGIVDVVL